MSKKQKRLEKFISHPETTPYSIIQAVLLDHGFEKISWKGSHLKFAHPSLEDKIIFPIHHNDTKPHYKKVAVNLLKKIL